MVTTTSIRNAVATALLAAATFGCTSGSVQTDVSSGEFSAASAIDATSGPQDLATRSVLAADSNASESEQAGAAALSPSVDIASDRESTDLDLDEDDSAGESGSLAEDHSAGPSSTTSSTDPSSVTTSPTSTTAQSTEPEPEVVTFSVNGGGTVTVEDGIFASYYDQNGDLQQRGTCSYADYSFVEVVDFAASFQTSLIERSPSATGQFLLFPLRVIVAGDDEPLIIENAAQFEARYEEIITADWVADVLEIDPVTVFCRYDGFMLGQGLFWADPTTGIFTIIHPTP